MKAGFLAAVSVTTSLSAFATSLPGQPTFRNLTGTVQDRHHEPLKGAVVEIENEDTKNVISDITDRSGRYNFKYLEGEAGYHVWFTYRGQRSKVKQLSHFDDHHDATINLVVKSD
ncbi:MAG: carboxypeptidase-like regulatory domain-containing protein [Edaphobacter sp.]